MAESIRVSKGIVIGVNDDGDTIVLDVNNALFAERYIQTAEAIDRICDSIDTNLDLSESEQTEYIVSKMREVMEQIDILCGEEACTKIFGEDVVPTAYAVLDFIEQLAPIIEKYATQRQKEIITKYKARTGGKK